MSKHKEIGPVNEFCPVPGKPCECGNDYAAVCKPGWAGKWKFQQGTTGKSWGTWEAHHILSISCVNWLPDQKSKQEQLLNVFKAAKWCINAKRNMLAMPKFGHTVMYYVDIMGTHPSATEFKQIRRRNPPPFADIPQHDFEHNTKDGYCTEVKDEISALWDRVAKAVEQHKLGTADYLVSELNRLSGVFRSKLRDRGKRQRGTHKAWNAGRDDGSSKWYLPFSMATAAHAAERHHPMTWDDKASDKMEAIWNSLVDAGAV